MDCEKSSRLNYSVVSVATVISRYRSRPLATNVTTYEKVTKCLVTYVMTMLWESYRFVGRVPIAWCYIYEEVTRKLFPWNLTLYSKAFQRVALQWGIGLRVYISTACRHRSRGFCLVSEGWLGMGSEIRPLLGPTIFSKNSRAYNKYL